MPAPAHAVISETRGPHDIRFIHITQIHKHGPGQQVLEPGKVKITIGVPFGQQYHGVGALKRGVDLVKILDPGRQQRPRLGHPLWVMGMHPAAVFHEPRQDGQRGRGAHIVGLRLEGQTQHRDGPALFAAAERGADLLNHARLLRVIDLDHRLDNAAGHPVLLGDARQRLGVLGKTGTAVTGAGVQKLPADAPVQPHAPGHRMGIGAQRLAQGRNLVDKADLGGQKGIGGIFGQLRALQVHLQQRRLNQVQGPVERAQHGLGALGFHPDHNPIRAHEIGDRRAFA